MCVNALAYLLATEDEILAPAVVGFLVVAKLTLASFVSILSNRAVHERDTAFFGIATGFALLHGLAECLAEAGTTVIVVLGLGANLSVANWAVVLLLGGDAHCRVDGGSELGCLAHGGSRARAGGLAIEHTLHLACEIPCLLVGSVGGTMRSEGLLVVGLGLALTIELLLRSGSDRSGEGFGSLLSFTLSFGPGGHSSSVDSLGGSVSARGVEGSALALGEGREGPGLEVDLGAGGLGDFSGGGDEVLVSLGLGLGCGLYVGLAEVHTMLALGHSIYDLLARVDVGLHIFAGFRDELATIFVACSSGSHLVDLLLGFGEVIVDSVMRILRDHGVSDWGRRGVYDSEGEGED